MVFNYYYWYQKYVIIIEAANSGSSRSSWPYKTISILLFWAGVEVVTVLTRFTNSKVFYTARSPQSQRRIFYHCLQGQLSTTCINTTLKQPSNCALRDIFQFSGRHLPPFRGQHQGLGSTPWRRYPHPLEDITLLKIKADALVRSGILEQRW